ncbi:MAG TPA: STAS domain-containing protein [Geomonas sp.]|nr:STAS domain-containing protein [Geomonas sp.]
MSGRRPADGEAPAVKLTRTKTATRLEIGGEMTIERAGELRESLLEAFQAGKPVQLSLSAVTSLDASGLQLLCSAHRTSLVSGVGLVVEGEQSELFRSVAELAGMFRPAGCRHNAGGSCLWKNVEQAP